VILFCRGSCTYAHDLAALNPSAISFDWEQDLSSLRAHVPSHIAVQGNLDPEIFRGEKSHLEAAVQKLLGSMEGKNGFIFNLGHGVLPDTPVENALAAIKLVQCSNK
jgi:uroporphyrinogen decarboxylase